MTFVNGSTTQQTATTHPGTTKNPSSGKSFGDALTQAKSETVNGTSRSADVEGGTVAAHTASYEMPMVLPPTDGPSPAPSPNDPPGTILPGDLGDLSIEVKTGAGERAVGINDLLNGNFTPPPGTTQTPQQLGQSLVWQYLKGSSTPNGDRVNNNYAGNNKTLRLDAVLRACDPQTAYKLLTGQLPDPANSPAPGSPGTNPQNAQDQKMLQNEVKQLVANGTFTAGDVRELVDAQAKTGDPYQQISNGLAAIVNGLPNNAQGAAVKKEFATESLNQAAAAKNPDQREFFAAQAATGLASTGHDYATSVMHDLAKSDPGKLNILIQGGLGGQARAEQADAKTGSWSWDPEGTKMNGATQLLQWAADDAADPNVGGPYNVGTGSPQQKQFAAQVFNDVMDFFHTDREAGTSNVTFSSGALPGESDLKSLQDTLLTNDGQQESSVRLAMAEMMDNSFTQIMATETGGGVALKSYGASRLADFGRIEFGHYGSDGNKPDWISQYAAQAYGTHLGQLLSGLQQYQQSGSTASLQSNFPGLFQGSLDTQAEVASGLAGGLFGAMSSGIRTDRAIVSGDADASQQQQQLVLSVLGGVLSAAAAVIPVFGDGPAQLAIGTLLGVASSGTSVASALDPNYDTGNEWDPVMGDANKFYNALDSTATGDQATRENNLIGAWQRNYSYFDLTANS